MQIIVKLEEVPGWYAHTVIFDSVEVDFGISGYFDGLEHMITGDQICRTVGFPGKRRQKSRTISISTVLKTSTNHMDFDGKDVRFQLLRTA